ncbi:MAG TPA: sugar phosphate isomerase/epimerase [Ruminiclostridium sp.]
MHISVFFNHIVEASEQTGCSIDEVLKKVRSFGIDSVEFDMGELPEPMEMYNRLQNAGLSVSSIYGFYNFGQNPEGKLGYDQVDMALAMHANKIMIIPGFLKGNILAERETEKQNMLKAMQQICEYADAYKVLVTIEDFDDETSPIAISDGMLWFATQIPSLKVTFDTGNFMYSCEPELVAFDKLKSRIVHVHCKDRSVKKIEGEEPKANMEGTLMYSSPVGYGVIHMKEIIAMLKEMDYQGTLTIEHFGSLNHIDYMEKSAKWIKSQIVY